MKTGMAFLMLLLNSGLIFIGATAYTVQKEYQIINNQIDEKDSFYSLQKYVIPQHYDINIMLHITEDSKIEFDFSGNVTINITIFSHLHYIKLHAQKPYINVYSSMLIKERIKIKSFTSEYHDETNILTIFFDTVLLPGNYSLIMQFNGTSSDDGIGLFKTFYKNRIGRTEYFVGTRFQPIGARRIFPCWDEPEIRSKFTITIGHYSSYTVISNPILQIEEILTESHVIEEQYMMTRFETTPAIPTYLATIVITKFEDPLIELEGSIVWFKESLLDYINFAKKIATQVVDQLQKKWKNEKVSEWIEIISIPGFQDNGIANFGLIFFREADVVYNKRLDPAIQKIKVASLIAREMAHHWFGNNISPFRWHDLWVNDGIAMLLGMEVIDQIYPKFRIMDLFVVQTLHESLHLDGYIEMPPFSYKSKAPTDINSLFFLPRYSKASAILRMMKYVLTDDVFWYGAELHLGKYKLNTATSGDFWSSMEIALEKKSPHYGYNLQEIIDLWTDKTDYPVLQVIRNYYNASNVLIWVNNASTQHNQRWQIPLTITTQTEHNFTLPFRDYGKWLITTWYPTNNEFFLPYEEDGWIIVNLQQTGYYRVNYDETNWKRIIQFLGTEKYTDIHVLNRAQIIDDAFHLMLTQGIHSSIFWNLTNYLRQDTDYIAWYPMFKALEFMSCILPLPSTDVKIIKENIRPLLTDLLKNIGYNENRYNENDLTKSLRQEAARWACVLNDSVCIQVAENKLTYHLTNPATHKLLPWWKSWTYCNGVTTEKKWAQLMIKYQNHPNHNILKDMACCENFYTIQIFLKSLTLNLLKKAKDSVYSFFYIVAKHAKFHKVFDYLLDQYKLNQFDDIKPKEVSMNAAIVYLINHVYTYEQLFKIQNVMKDKTNTSAYRNIYVKIVIRKNEIRKQLVYLKYFLMSKDITYRYSMRRR